MTELYEINSKILDKIDEFDILKNKKDFLKEALLLQFKNRDVDFDEFEEEYRKLVDKYSGDGVL